MRFKLTLEYDGSAYAGWQKQKNAVTVQGSLIEAIEAAFSENNSGQLIDLQGAGRTDTGVHAFGQVAHLDCKTALSAGKLLKRINEKLPPTIHILSLEPTDKNFHARHSARSRQYLYRISSVRSAFDFRYHHWVKGELDQDKMNQALGYLLGMHDFASFSSSPEQEKSTLVLVESVELVAEDEMLMLRIKASHFLWNMVRNLVGVLIEIGKGRLKPEIIEQALQTYQPGLSKWRAPASGLFLEEVGY